MEIIGPGIALLDYDNDGKLDVLVLRNAARPGNDSVTGVHSAPVQRSAINPILSVKVHDASPRNPPARAVMHGTPGDFDNDVGFVDVLITHLGAPSQPSANKHAMAPLPT